MVGFINLPPSLSFSLSNTMTEKKILLNKEKKRGEEAYESFSNDVVSELDYKTRRESIKIGFRIGLKTGGDERIPAKEDTFCETQKRHGTADSNDTIPAKEDISCKTRKRHERRRQGSK